MGPLVLKYPVQKLILLLFLALAVVPVLNILFHIFFTPGVFRTTLASFNLYTWRLLGQSLLLATAVALLATLSGTALGFFLFRSDLPGRTLLRTLLLIPLFLSPYLLAVAWKDLFFLSTGTTAFITSPAGVVLVLTTLYTPLAMLIAGTALAAIDISYEESGWLLAGRRNTLLHITLPLIRPALFSAFVMVFIFTLSEFSVPAVLGVKVFTTEIFTRFSAFYDHTTAIGQSAVLVGICFLLLAFEARYLSEAPFLSLGRRGGHAGLYRGRGLRRVGLFFVLFWLGMSVVLPFAVLTGQAFHGGMAVMARALALLLPAAPSSLLLAAGGGMLILITGAAAAWRRPGTPPSPLNRGFDLLLLLLFALPATVLGIALIHFYNRPSLAFLYGGPAIILVGYTARYAFLAARLTGNALRQLPASFDEAARLAAIPPLRRLLHIHLPLLLPALAASFLLGFILSLGELGTTLMVYPPGTTLLPVKLYTLMANAPQPLTSAMTLVVMSITFAATTLAYLLLSRLLKRSPYAASR